MVNKLVKNSRNDGFRSDSSTRDTRNPSVDGKKASPLFKWIFWLILIVATISFIYWLFSPGTVSTTIESYSYDTNTHQILFKRKGESKSHAIKKNARGTLILLGDGAFMYAVSTEVGTVRLPGTINTATDPLPLKPQDQAKQLQSAKVGNSKELDQPRNQDQSTTVSYPVYTFTATSGMSLWIYDAPDGRAISVGSLKRTKISDLPGGDTSFVWLGGLSRDLQLPSPIKATIVNIFSSVGMLFIWMFALYYFFFRRMRVGGDEESIFSIGKSLSKLAKTKVKFTDVAGIVEEKQELIEIVDYLKHPGKYVAMGARIPRGVILYGPPGTGKTLLAKAVAGEAQVPFFQIAGSTFEDMFVGVGAKRVRDLFNKARKAAPCIIFIDEIDSVGGKRGRSEIIGGSYSTSEQTINQLLGEMDGFETKTGIVVIAATNRIDVLDEALLRPGRFDRHIRISLPDVREREEILILHARNKNFSSKIDFADIARRTPGFSGAQLESTLNEAVLLAVRNNRTVILESDIDEAIDRVIAGPAKVSRTMTERERQQIAYHEAGHALTGLHLNEDEEIQKITIIPRGNTGGYTLSAPKGYETNLKRKSELLNMVAVFMGGRASEEIIYGKDNISSGASDDLYKATNVVRGMVTQLGMSSLGKTQYIPSQGTLNPNLVKLYSDETALAIDKEINKILDEAYQRSSEIIRNNLDELKLIVDALLTVETIVKHDVEFIHKNKRLPDEIIAKKQKAQPTVSAEVKA